MLLKLLTCQPPGTSEKLFGELPSQRESSGKPSWRAAIRVKVLKIEPACMRDWVASFCAWVT